MPASYEFHRVPCEDIKVVRDERQRSNLSGISELADSIAHIGLLHPIIITRDNVLVAGERRLLAWKSLGYKDKAIPVHYIDELDESELKAIELEENIKRRVLHWKDTVKAVAVYHVSKGCTVEDTADALGFARSRVYVWLSIAKALEAGDKRIKEAENLRAAENILARRENRRIQTELSKIDETIDVSSDSLTFFKEEKEEEPIFTKRINTTATDIICIDVIDWLEKYNGKKFNFMHCDLPFGIDINKSAKSKTKEWTEYDDSEKNYWMLCEALIEHKDKILYSSAHVMFWFSMTYYQKTLDLFSSAGFKVDPFPLIWHKSDNKGITPDPKRGPRRSYETAFLMTLDERFIITPVQNVVSAATTKVAHPSEKPEYVLEHFFRMLVDDMTEMLDPTCGGGGALRVADRLGAERILGIEVSEDYADVARTLLGAERSGR